MIGLRITLGFAAILTASASFAEPPTGSRLGKRTLDSGVAMTARDKAVGARDMAKCLFHRHKREAMAMLAAGSSAESQLHDRRLSGEVECMSMMVSNDLVDTRIVSYPHDVLRGMFAEMALQDARDAASRLQPLPLEQKRYLRPWFEATSRNSAVDEMGVCIADTNPSGIIALIGTEPESPREDAAFASLNDSLGKCLSAGTRLQASRQALRAALAEALYQRLRNPALSLPAMEAAAN